MCEPTKLALGPYHHGTEASQAFEANKWKCLDHLAMLKQDKDVKYSRETTLKKIFGRNGSSIEQTAKNVYSEDITMDGKSFSQMLLLDGCFILAQVIGFEQTKQDSVPLYLKSWCNPYVVHDLLLLENQILFFAIEKIYHLIFGEDTSSSLHKRVVTFFEQCIMSSYLKYIPQTRKLADFHHLLHLYLMSRHPARDHKNRYLDEKATRQNPCPNNQNNFLHPTRWRRATMYEEVGIKLRKKEFDEKDPHSLLDITFRKNMIEIPALHINSSTSVLFKKLVVLEQSCPQYGNHFMTYVIFLTQIMSMQSDIMYLIKNEIISHSLVSDGKVFNLFSSLRGNVMFDLSGKYYLKYMNQVVEESYQKGLKRWVVRTGLTDFEGPAFGFSWCLGSFISFLRSLGPIMQLKTTTI